MWLLSVFNKLIHLQARSKNLRVFIACSVLLTCSVQAQVELISPRGGWNASGLVDKSEESAAAYPYNLIDRGSQKYRTLIRGKLAALATAQAKKGVESGDTGAERRAAKAPYTLVVNGNPMPLYTGDDGEFARPYAFGPGSNSVEIKHSNGRSAKRVQFYETPSARPKAALRIIAAWDDNQAEVDMHVITPDGQHAFWAAPVLQGGGGLDADSVDGAGPEMFSLAAPQRGAYHVYVNYWGNFGDSGYHFDEATRRKPIITVRITMIFQENTLRERRESFVLPLRKIGDLMHVKSVVL
jgi:uncharacterized protein YfaP (DUF2135 family)